MDQFPEIPMWVPNEVQADMIARLDGSDDEADRARAEALKNRCYVYEEEESEKGAVVAVGDLDILAGIEQRLNVPIKIGNFTLYDCLKLGGRLGVGDSRAERIRDGVRQVLEARAEQPAE
jgi:hypothetical protein